MESLIIARNDNLDILGVRLNVIQRTLLEPL